MYKQCLLFDKFYFEIFQKGKIAVELMYKDNERTKIVTSLIKVYFEIDF